MIPRVIYIALVLVLVSPTQVFGSVILSEIMYDLDGSDSNREWVEIFNPDSTAVSLSGWKFYENDSNHKLTRIQGSESLASGEYAVIANNTDAFLLDWPGFSGILFDSAFSLNNTGETVTIRNSELVDVNSVTYSSEWGAKGDGNSLYYTGTEWAFGNPTPGSGPLVSVSNSGEQSGNQVEGNSSSGVSSSFPVEPQIFAFAGDDRTVTVGASSLFEGRALGFSGEALSGARFVWSFGDGGRQEGESVLHHYRYPGEYVVVLDVSSGEYSATDRILVSALPAQISITGAGTDNIELSNQSEREINLSWWIFKTKNDSFVIPENTIVLPKQSVTFSSEVTNLFPKNISEVSLLYPNGTPVSLEYAPEEELIGSTSGKQTATQKSISEFSQQSIVGKEVSAIYNPTEVSYGDVETEKSSEYFSQGAHVAKSITGGENNPLIYWFLLAGIIVSGSISAIVLRRRSQEEITIIE